MLKAVSVSVCILCECLDGKEVHLDQRRDQPGLEVHHSFAGLGQSLQVAKERDVLMNIVNEIFIILILTYQDQVLNEVGQASVGEHHEPGDGSGNSLRVSFSWGVRVSRVGTLVAVLGAAASRNQLKINSKVSRKIHW